ncbi:beta-glucanase [Kitasatospora sp. NBC_01250]|uniref:beta-glucanase n=1 Tax=unclassified Kitasatospora TaxID=2633591 RepID=UPI002E1052EE|nr:MULTISPECIES: beta-glucanase [unclassified Kitasatospora]WSJ69809.1 beta-glucanase [Kitasatospora sp. NBC_01302]
MRLISLPLGLMTAIALTVSTATVAGAAPGAGTSAPFAAATVAFTDDFHTLDVGPGHTWGWQTGAYQDCVDNQHDFKLDHLSESALSAAGGHLTITASPRPDGNWDTGLLTTGDSCDTGGDGTEIRTGDLIMAHVRLPDADSGAWPALWSWRDGQNEVDVFEWQADHPGTLEFVNQVHSGTGRYTNAAVSADGWLYVGARLGADNTTWYVGPSLDHLAVAYADHSGVGPDFAAYPVLSLSVNNGVYHPAPTTSKPISFSVDSLTVYRPAPPGLPDS